jgi:2-polyprenyl-3-methyl-5-hydroxy-6-metoxy-1,4-benzoquinol methylase
MNARNSSYRFYHPYDMWLGIANLYEQLQKYDWYYMPWKWEHETTLMYIENGQSVLEVGCGNGSFLKKINEIFDLNESIGLELNRKQLICSDNYNIVNKYVQEYQIENQSKYDIVCSYQVLEHISDVFGFIDAKLNCLKIGGKLIISVPNNDSFIQYLNSALNMPPHHMGLWNKKSIQYSGGNISSKTFKNSL